ncbi:MAG: hypothetical protein ACXVWY_11145 [Nocardioides sp.]
MTRRQQAYFLFRGSSAGVFLLSATVLPRGVPAVVGCVVAGMGGLLTCLGVNAGGPGESAGALAQGVRYEKVRAPQGDWPPFDPGMVVDGELAPAPTPPRRP